MAARLGGIPDHLPYLTMLHGPGDRRPRVLDRDVSTIGRARGCDLCLEASDVSTIHCVLFRSRRGYYVRDCNSRTGTRVNGDALRGPQQLSDGDILHVGPFSFEVHVPRRLSSPNVALPDPAKLTRQAESRRRLAEHALRLRRQLRERPEDGTGARAVEVQHELARVGELARVHERRLHDLNAVDRELEAEREQFRSHVQDVERQLAERLAQAEREIRERWQDFQRRCRAEEAQLALPTEQPAPTHGRATEVSPTEREQALAHCEQQLAQQHQALTAERQELERMKQQFANGHATADAAVAQQRAALAQQEASLRSQRGELARMIQELRALQEQLNRPVADELAALLTENEHLRQNAAQLQAQLAEAPADPRENETRAENELLRMLLEDRERELADAQAQLTLAPQLDTAAAPAELETLRTENMQLRERLAEQGSAIEELRAKSAPRPAKSASELESYEAELTQERQQLDAERARLGAEMDQLRMRNEELDETTRDLEMQMSRERAEMARERMRMDRLREELKQDMEKLQREISVRESLAPVNRLRDEMNQKKPGGSKVDPAAERLRQLRHNDTPRS